MTTTTAGIQNGVRARRAGFVREVMAVASRALRSLPRDLETVIPPLIFPVFFFAVAVGALQDVAEGIPGIDYKAFQLPVAIIFAVTGIVLGILIKQNDFNPYLALLIAMALGTSVGLVNGLVITKLGVPSFVVTLGALVVIGPNSADQDFSSPVCKIAMNAF